RLPSGTDCATSSRPPVSARRYSSIRPMRGSMADIRSLPALADRRPLTSPQVTLSALPEGTVLQVIAGPKTPDLTRLAGEAGLVARAIAPGQWFLVGNRPTAHQDMRRLLAMLEPDASGIDQSHGRVRMLMEGPMAAAV